MAMSEAKTGGLDKHLESEKVVQEAHFDAHKSLHVGLNCSRDSP